MNVYGVKKYDPETGCWPDDAVNEDGTVKLEALAEYEKEMREKTIPAIVETMKRRAELAEESRKKFIW